MRLHPGEPALRHALYWRDVKPGRRLWQHRSGNVKGFTSRYGVHRLVRFELFGTMDAAITREKQLKRWHRQWKINLIESENPDWHDLATGLGLPSVHLSRPAMDAETSSA